MRAIIVDDELPARALLRALLAELPDVEIVAECGNGVEALAAIERLRPDLVFLDVQMPELDGFGVVEALPASQMPAFLFVTAYDRYALRAFEINAVDYLLKPFDSERLELAVERARQRVGHSGREGRRLLEMIDVVRRESRRYQRLVIRVGDRTLLQDVREIDWLEADAKHVRVHVGAQTHVMRDSIGRLEERLDPASFVRVSRSAIINLARIAEIRPWFKGELLVFMRNGARIPTTRSYRTALTDILEERS